MFRLLFLGLAVALVGMAPHARATDNTIVHDPAVDGKYHPESQDMYRRLGIAHDADEHDIKTAYRLGARKYHPDVNPGDKLAELKFKLLAEAWEVLGKRETKARYDRHASQVGHEAAGEAITLFHRAKPASSTKPMGAPTSASDLVQFQRLLRSVSDGEARMLLGQFLNTAYAAGPGAPIDRMLNALRLFRSLRHHEWMANIFLKREAEEVLRAGVTWPEAVELTNFVVGREEDYLRRWIIHQFLERRYAGGPLKLDESLRELSVAGQLPPRWLEEAFDGYVGKHGVSVGASSESDQEELLSRLPDWMARVVEEPIVRGRARAKAAREAAQKERARADADHAAGVSASRNAASASSPPPSAAEASHKRGLTGWLGACFGWLSPE